MKKFFFFYLFALLIAFGLRAYGQASADPYYDPGGMAKLSNGNTHVLLVKSDGTVWAWGGNSNGQLGDGTTTQRNSPVQVAGLTDVLYVAGGSNHSLALKADGTVWAWGGNSNGRLGDNSTIDRNSPVQVVGPGGVGFLQDIIAIGAGESHSLALRADGTVWAWGNQSNGRLGNNFTTGNSLVPVQVLGVGGVGFLTDIIGIGAGQSHSVALKADGTVFAWGLNGNGQLGDNTTTQRATPVQVAGMMNAIAVAAGGSSSYALRADGTLWAWGLNGNGQLGDNSTTQRNTPVQVSGLTNVKQIKNQSTVASFSALRADGTLWAWGFNLSGRLGDGTGTQRITPVQVSGVNNVATYGGQRAFNTAMKADGTIVAWGTNSSGQFGDGTTTGSFTAVASLAADDACKIIQTAANDFNTIFLRSDGRVAVTGENNHGQLGTGSTSGNNGNLPFLVENTNIRNIIMVEMGRRTAYALRADGTVWAWGQNDNGQTGNGNTVSPQLTPINGTGLTNVKSLAVGDRTLILLLADGTLRTVGQNDNGQTGNGNMTSPQLTLQTPALTNVKAVSSEDNHTLALLANGTVQGYGEGDQGRLGNGSTASQSSPVTFNLSGGLAKAVSVGTYHSSVVLSNGTVRAAGENSSGELGDGTTTSTNTGTPSLTTAANVNANIKQTLSGDSYTLYLKSDGTVWGTGAKFFGILADGTISGSTGTGAAVPYNVGGSLARYINGGYIHNSVLLANGTPRAAGINSDGQLGNGTTTENGTNPAVTANIPSCCPLGADVPVSGNATCRGGNGSINITNPTGAASYEFTINAPSSSSTTGATWASATSYTPAAGTYHVWMRDVPTTCEKFLGTVTITEPAALAFTLFNQTNNACHGGTAGALTLNNPTGGNASATYTYAWSNGGTTQAISGLAAGTYTVTVSAVGCPGVELTADYTITEAPAMSALTVASQTNITCVGVNDGAVSITTPTGGSIPAGYAYSWSNGATTQGISGLSAGIYTVTVTAGMSGTCVNVTRTLEVTITTPAVMSDPVITSQTNITCHGATNGQATIGTPTGGATSPSYTYDWPSGADTQTRTDLAAGTYTVTVTACMGGTPKTVTVNITEPVQHNATVQHTPESCGGAADGTITISGSVGALDDIYEYSINSTNGTDGNWFGESTTNGRVFTGLTGSPMPGTTYRVWQRSATHPTCFFELSSVTMVAPPALTANITGFVEPPCSAPFTGSINIDVSGGNFTSQYTYQWTGPSGFSATTQNVTGITIGTYTVTITAVGCVPPLTRTLFQVINFAAIPTVNPSTIAVASTSTNSASISWGSVMGATNYTFRFRPVGANTWTSVINTTNTFINLTSLLSGTEYEFQVAVSGGGPSCLSAWEPAPSRRFTTTTASGGGSTSCVTPTDFVVNNVTTTTAEASWSTNAAKCYLIQYGLATQTQSTWPEVFIAHPASMLTLTGLQPGRSYRARIRANCTTCSNPSSFGTRTAYSALVSFNTPATRESLSGLRESVSVYPNPSQGSFNVKFASEAGTVVTLRLLDLKGTVVYESTHSATDGENILPVVIEHYTRGIYALQIQRGTQVTTTRVSLD